MSNQRDILQRLHEHFISQDTPVTYLGQGGVIAAILRANSYEFDILDYEYDVLRRDKFLATATGDSLDALGEERGVERLGSNAAGVILSFSNSSGSEVVVPAGTVAQSASGVQFQTVADLTLDALTSDYTAYPLLNKVFARATTAGATGNVPAKSITQITPPITDVAVINHYPAQNGKDIEGDMHYRMRIALNSAMNETTTFDFYRVRSLLCDTQVGGVDVGTRILRTMPMMRDPRTVILFVLTKDGAGLSDAEKVAMKNYLEIYCPILTTIRIANVVFTPITLDVKVHLDTGYTVDGIWPNVASKLANFIDWSRWDWGQNVDDADLISVVRNCEGITNVVTDEFYTHVDGGLAVPGDVFVAANSLPRLVSLEIRDASTTTGETDVRTGVEFAGAESMSDSERLVFGG